MFFPIFDHFSTLRAAMATAGVALLLAGCGPSALLPYRPDDPVSVHVPAAIAGVRDERGTFAALFQRELDGAAKVPGGPWLHGPTLTAAQAEARLTEIDQRFNARRRTTAVLVVPGLLGDCIDDQAVPFGDGQVRGREAEATEAYAPYADLGLADLRMIPLSGRASSARNGALLAEALRAAAAKPGVAQIVLVGYSKGVPDTLEALAALEATGSLPAQVAALVSVAGVVAGTPLADHYEGMYATLSPHVSPLNCAASEGGELASLTRRDRLRWLSEHRPPDTLAYYSIAAYTDAEETNPILRTSHQLLAASDPRNDGQVTLGDAILPGSTLLATARADHWAVALPLERSNHLLIRALAGGQAFPREALFRATLKWVIGTLP